MGHMAHGHVFQGTWEAINNKTCTASDFLILICLSSRNFISGAIMDVINEKKKKVVMLDKAWICE